MRRFEAVSGRGRWRIKPAGYIHYPYAISIVFVMSCSCQKHFGSSFDFPARLTPHSTFMSGVRMTAASLFS